MKKNENLEKDTRGIMSDSLLRAKEHGDRKNVFKNLRKIVFIASLACIVFFVTGCMAGYVATTPTYTHSYRPPQPSGLYIWVDGNWSYNYMSHSYVEGNGYWKKSNQRHNYVPGYWQSSTKGYSWVRGHNEKRNNQKNRANR